MLAPRGMAANTMAKAAKVAALSANTAATPTRAMSSPATAGPTARARFIATPFSAAADRSCERGTRS